MEPDKNINQRPLRVRPGVRFARVPHQSSTAQQYLEAIVRDLCHPDPSNLAGHPNLEAFFLKPDPDIKAKIDKVPTLVSQRIVELYKDKLVDLTTRGFCNLNYLEFGLRCRCQGEEKDVFVDLNNLVKVINDDGESDWAGEASVEVVKNQMDSVIQHNE
ncbi:hypothetical protein M231_02934 [Tremella mesenterica]|uniref:Uncharacterized protein n=1 Tax=Tremella mesenterica TaxID=5217 RepID=A0A4Q1BPC8_TREME|nr:hypothetical protein M231_02934 [Tremella mesenterica]